MSAPVVEVQTFVDEPSSMFTNSQRPLGVCSDVKSKICNRVPPSTGQGSKSNPINISGNKTVFDFFVDSERILLRETAIALTVYFTNATGNGDMVNAVPIWDPWAGLVSNMQFAVNGGSPFVYQTVAGYFLEQHLAYMYANFSETALNSLEWCMTPAFSPTYAISDVRGGRTNNSAVAIADGDFSVFNQRVGGANVLNGSSVYTQRLLKYFGTLTQAAGAVTATNSQNKPFHIIIPLGDALGIRWSASDIAAANIHKIHLEITWNPRVVVNSAVPCPMFVSAVSSSDYGTALADLTLPSARANVASCFMLVPVINMSAGEKLSTVDGKMQGKNDIVGFIGSAPLNLQPSQTMMYSGVANVDSVFTFQSCGGRRGINILNLNRGAGPDFIITVIQALQYFSDHTQTLPFNNYRIPTLCPTTGVAPVAVLMDRLIITASEAPVNGCPTGLTMSYGTNLQSMPSYPIPETDDGFLYVEELYYYYKSLTGKYGRRDLVPMLRSINMATTTWFEALRGWGPEHITLSRVALNLQIRHAFILNGPATLTNYGATATYSDDAAITLIPMIVFAFTAAPDSRISTFVGY